MDRKLLLDCATELVAAHARHFGEDKTDVIVEKYLLFPEAPRVDNIPHNKFIPLMQELIDDFKRAEGIPLLREE